MPAKYHRVSPNLWDQRFRALSPRAQRLYLYIATSPHRHSEGLFRIPLPYIAVDTGMAHEEISAALHDLEQAGWVMYDHAAEVILDGRAMEFFPPKGSSQFAGALRALKSVPNTHLKQEFAKLAFLNCRDFYTCIVDGVEHGRGREEGCPDLVIDEPVNRVSTGLSRARARARQLEEEQEQELEISKSTQEECDCFDSETCEHRVAAIAEEFKAEVAR